MYFYLSALSLLYRISDLFSRLNFGSAVFFHSEKRALHTRDEEKIFAGRGPGFGHR